MSGSGTTQRGRGLAKADPGTLSTALGVDAAGKVVQQPAGDFRGKDGASPRIVEVTGNGAVALTGFSAVLAIIPKPTWNGNQCILGEVAANPAPTKTGFTAVVRRSKGTLLASDQPFEAAPSTTKAAFTVEGMP